MAVTLRFMETDLINGFPSLHTTEDNTSALITA